MINRIRTIFLLGICMFLPLCTVFSQDTVETIVREASANSETALVHIRTNVSGVEVFMNNLYKGIAPLTLEDVVPATYAITLRKDGWERKSVFVQLNAQTETNLYFELVPITGFLSIQSNISDAEIYLDGSLIQHGDSIDTGLIEVQEGFHTVEIKKFGYETQSKNVTVYERFLTEVRLEPKRSLFKINSFTSTPEAFNPLAPGGLGLVHFNFSVTAPGSAVFTVVDKNDEVVFSKIFSTLESPHHSAEWNGKNSLGITLPNGRYRASLEAMPASGWQSFETISSKEDNHIVKASTITSIDNSIFYPIVGASASGTSSGIANARIMPIGTTLVSFSGATNFSLDSGFSAFPFSLTTVFTPFSIMELSFRFGAEAESAVGENFPVFFGGSIKVSNKINNVFIAGLMRYTYASEPTLLTTYSESGLGVGGVLALETGNILLSLSEEAVFGSETGNVLDFAGHIKSALGLQYQKGAFSSNVWVSLFSPFSFSGLKFFEMLETGFDISLLLPSTIVSPTLGCTYNYSEQFASNIAIRFGLNIFIP